MDEFSGRTVIEAGQVIELPLLPFPSVVLVPGQMIPLHLFQSQVRDYNISFHSILFHFISFHPILF